MKQFQIGIQSAGELSGHIHGHVIIHGRAGQYTSNRTTPALDHQHRRGRMLNNPLSGRSNRRRGTGAAVVECPHHQQIDGIAGDILEHLFIGIADQWNRLWPGFHIGHLGNCGLHDLLCIGI